MFQLGQIVKIGDKKYTLNGNPVRKIRIYKIDETFEANFFGQDHEVPNLKEWLLYERNGRGTITGFDREGDVFERAGM